MTAPTIRPMLPSDVATATELILRNNWGARREWFELSTSQPHGFPIVAEADGELVGTGVGSANGTVGWVGTIFVVPERRGQGLGRALTQEVIDRLEGAGCRTLVLVATTEGRPLYERMGFEVQTHYRILEATGPLPEQRDAAAPVVVRPFAPADLGRMAALDAVATGERRNHLLERFASAESAKVAVEESGDVAGFVVRAPWGGGATIAANVAVAMAILEARRRAAGPDGRVRVGLLEENDAGLAAVARAGLAPIWSAPRMIRGAALDWHPERIWGQFNHAIG